MKILFATCAIAMTLLLPGCQSQDQKDELVARQHCATCHSFPDASLLSKRVWKADVLPQMEFYMGRDFSLLKKYPAEDQENVSEKLPNAAMVTDAQWESIRRYYERKAPDTILAPVTNIVDSVRQFTPLPLRTSFFPMNTFVSFDQTSGSLYMGSRSARLYQISKNLKIQDSIQLSSAPSQIEFRGDHKATLLSMGIMDPNDQAVGALLDVDLKTHQFKPVIESLKRPVFFARHDLNKDGLDDYVICEFGNVGGSLTLYKNDASGKFSRTELISLPGARKVMIRDIDGNGMDDIIAMMTQGDEKIVVLLNYGDFNFRMNTLLKFPPVYGSSYFDIADFNGDSKPDILYCNGDNADLSMILKPYHGVRIFLNNGNNDFRQSWFHNVHGATQAVARDFDGDGDTDIATIAFFPPFETMPVQGFVYFENKKGIYVPQITRIAADGRWISFSCADYDGDGDEDLLLSALDFNNGVPADLLANWKRKKISLLVLKNNFR